MKRFAVLICILALLASMCGCGTDGSDTTYPQPTDPEDGGTPTGKLVVLYTSDVHNAYRTLREGALGYAAVAAYRQKLADAGNTVLLIDGGDALFGTELGTLSQGEGVRNLMDAAEYDLAVPGDADLAFGEARLLALAEDAQFEYLCCNWRDKQTGEPVFAPYRMVTVEDVKIAVVGITAPRRSEIYDFCAGEDGQQLYDAVQDAIDDARAEGAKYIIAVGHLGSEPADAPWGIADVAANTTGLCAILDSRSHGVLEQVTLEDADGKEIPVLSVGQGMQYLGQLTLDLSSGDITAELIEKLEKEKTSVLEAVQEEQDKLDEHLKEHVAVSEAALYAYDPKDSTVHLSLRQQTNLGELCADAYRVVLDADVGLVLGSSLMADLPEGTLTWRDILNVYPFSQQVCVVEVTGQQLLNLLEFSCRSIGEDNTGYLQVSGVSFQVDTGLNSGLRVNEDGEFAGVAGDARRVRNVKVNGKALDVKATYTLAGTTYLLQHMAKGYTMLENGKLISQPWLLDHQVLHLYLTRNLENQILADAYGDKNGDGRIVVE